MIHPRLRDTYTANSPFVAPRYRPPVYHDDWRLQAFCADITPYPWDDDEPTPLVRKACGMCPVREECLASALEEEAGQRFRHGTRGGLGAAERKALLPRS